MNQYLIAFPDAATEHRLTAMATAAGADVRWVATEESEHDHEYAYVTEEIWDQVVDCVETALAESEEPPSGWPNPPFKSWTTAQRRGLIQTVVKQIGYCGNNGPAPDRIVAAWQRGELDPIPDACGNTAASAGA